jgi:hypothetical protein
LVHPLHILCVRNVELASLHTRGLIGQRSLKTSCLIETSSLKHGLLIGSRSFQSRTNIKLTSLKSRGHIGLLTGNVGTKHIRGKLLTHLLGSQKLLIDLLGHRNVLSRALTSSTRTGKGLTRNTSRALQTTRASRHLTRTLRGSTNLLSRKLTRALSPRHSLSLKRLTDRRHLLCLKGLLVKRLTKGSSPNPLRSYLTRSHPFSRYALSSHTLRCKSATKLNLLSCHLLGSEPLRRRHPLRADGLSLRSLHGKPTHLIQIATHLTPAKLSSLTKRSSHFRIGR